MRTAFLLAVAFTVLAQAAQAADDLAAARIAPAAIAADTHAAVPGTLLGSARVAVGRWLAGERDTQRWPTDAVSRSHRTGRTWIERHPVLTCTLVGAAAGAGMAAAVWGSEGAWVGTYTGGAAGAVVGAIVLK